MDISAAFDAAVAHHRAGRADEAEALYRDIVAADAGHFGAHDLLGLILVGDGRFEAAAEVLGRAVAIEPGAARSHLYLGFALRRLGRPEAALASFDRALALGRRDAELLNSRGAALLDLRRFADAAADFEAAIALAPDTVLAHENLGIALAGLQRHVEAAASYDRAIALDAGRAVAWFKRGLALKALKRPEAALASYDRALALRPGYAHAHHTRGMALVKLGRLEEALASVEAAIRLEPGLWSAHVGHGEILFKLGRYAEAVESLGRVPPDDPEYADARWNRALAALALGRFAEGWADYEHRWRRDVLVGNAAEQIPPQLLARLDPAVTRADLAGRRVLVASEQGVGDVLMFAGALPDLLADAGDVTLIAEPRLHRLLARSFPKLHLIAPLGSDAPPAADVVLAIGSLGRLYRNDPSDFPRRPYLSASPEVRAEWTARLGRSGGRLRIGVSWRGGAAWTRRSERSMALAQLRPLLDLPGCEVWSLQYGDVADEIAQENAGRDNPVRMPTPDAVADFEDLAGLVQSLDMVVSVQTALVHLAGALGTPTIVMTPRNPEWRYAGAGPSMSWYGSVTILRQGPDGDWGPVVREAVEAVRARRPGA